MTDGSQHHHHKHHRYEGVVSSSPDAEDGVGQAFSPKNDPRIIITTEEGRRMPGVPTNDDEDCEGKSLLKYLFGTYISSFVYTIFQVRQT